MYCTCNVTISRVRANIVVVEMVQVLYNLRVCICSLSYPARNVDAPYRYLRPALLYNFFHIFS